MLNETTIWVCTLAKEGGGRKTNEEECNKQQIKPMRKTSTGLPIQFDMCPLTTRNTEQ